MSAGTINLRALLGRINRKLAHEGEQLRTLRGERDFHNLGRYYAVNDMNHVIASHVDPETWGREMGVLPEGVEVQA